MRGSKNEVASSACFSSSTPRVHPEHTKEERKKNSFSSSRAMACLANMYHYTQRKRGHPHPSRPLSFLSLFPPSSFPYPIHPGGISGGVLFSSTGGCSRDEEGGRRREKSFSSMQ